ncbi:uncharacterized protein LOC143183489 [Calliopsis andreniformis]|uniref:uncharacterized protein LOC143183489 n=1 Tax=Calliopsis andreniformis TaxID=337506 RepID=UPI003FCC5A16
MGCGTSGSSCKKGGVRLMATKLVFTKSQLNNLNAYFRKLVDEAQNDSSNVFAIEAIVERLVQRLILTVGNHDRRFASMFLISLNEPRRVKQLKFEYLLRIDTLSSPSASSELEISRVNVEEDATLPGFIRLKTLAAGAEPWQDYVDAAGRLRRDLVKAKLANLLATAIKRDVGNLADEQICASPGQVVDAEVLDKILKQPDHCRIFYGSAVSDGPLPEPRDHRVALIEDAGGILLKIGLNGCKAREAEVRLLIGIGVSSWPNLADYPRRVPFHHCDALLHYTAAQSGMYAVAVGPYPGARCEDRATLWRIRVPAAEKIMSQHYARDSVPVLTESMLMEILYQLREGCCLNPPIKLKVARKTSPVLQDRLRVVSRHILKTVHRWTLERAGPDPLTSWAPDTISRHVLLALDELVTALKCQNLRCYFHPRCNVMLQCARGGVVHHEDSYVSDARLLQSYLETLHYLSFSMPGDVLRPLDVMESELIVRWRDIVTSLPRGTSDVDYGYSQRQLEYFSLIVEQVLRVKDALLQDHSDNCSCLNFPELTYHTTDQVESLVFLLKLTLTQAKDQIHAMRNRKMRASDHRNKESRRPKHYNTTSQFDYSVRLLIDVVRRDRETANMDLDSPPIMAKLLLQWLYFGMDYDRKILEPVLRPYLNNLFNSLHENGWFAVSWKSRQETYTSEMQSLSTFCKSVITQEVSPANGIVDCLSKGWRWAENTTKMIERSGNSLKLIFFSRGRVIRYNLTFAENKGLSSFATWSKARGVSTIARRKRVNSTTGEILDFLLELRETSDENKAVTGHQELRDVSPLTYVASMSRPRARQRGPGDLISAIISLGKFRVLQEAVAVLPREERVAMLEMVQRVARESARRSRRVSCLDESSSPRQIYRPRPESDLLDSSPRLSLGLREWRIVAEHQKQLEREMQEMHDTLRRNALTRQRPSAWDSYSVSSWSSSIDSFAGTITLRKQRALIWDAIRGGSRASDIAENKPAEMISREESPTWSTRRKLDDLDSTNGDELPSWDALEATLNRRLYNYGSVPPEFAEANGSIGEKPRE